VEGVGKGDRDYCIMSVYVLASRCRCPLFPVPLTVIKSHANTRAEDMRRTITGQATRLEELEVCSGRDAAIA
jgi:hypothetical protein